MTETLELIRGLYMSDKAKDDVRGVDLAVLTYLLLHVKGKVRVFHEAKGTIAKRLGISLDTLARSLKRLVAAGHVIVKSRGKYPAIFIMRTGWAQRATSTQAHTKGGVGN